MVERYQIYVGGGWRDGASGATMPAVNPFNQEVWAEVPVASASDVADSITAARRAFEGGWRQTSGLDRARLMHRLADLIDANAERLALIETTDNGKVIRETRSQMGYAARVYRFFAGYADKIWGQVIPLDQPRVLDMALREPLGVVGVIVPWNSPTFITIMSLAPALAAGNTIVIKPSEYTSASAIELARLAVEAGLPPGVLQVLPGAGAAVGDALVTHPLTRKISFTGSTAIGSRIMQLAAPDLKRVSLELGSRGTSRYETLTAIPIDDFIGSL